MKKMPHYHILNRSPLLEHKSLKNIFDKLKTDAERDSLSIQGIDSSFNKFVKIIDKL